MKWVHRCLVSTVLAAVWLVSSANAQSGSAWRQYSTPEEAGWRADKLNETRRKLFAGSEDTLFTKSAPVSMKIERDEKGKITGGELDYLGTKMKMRKRP